MNKFIKNLLLFILPIFVAGIFAEFFLRSIPNDYAYKKSYLDKNSAGIETLVLGSSHAFYGINPVYLQGNGFNASYVSQTLDYDYEILKKYDGHWNHLKYMVLPISYFSLFSNLKDTPESWRVKNYVIYYDIIKNSDNITSYFEVFNNKSEINLVRIKSYLLGESTITASELGWRVPPASQPEFINNGKIAARRHVEYAEGKSVEENLNTLKAIIDFADKQGIKILFFTPPAFHTYVDNLDKNQLNLVIDTMTKLDNEHPNVFYINFMTDKAFTEKDFINSDHLSPLGAEKLTKMIDKILIDMH